VRATLLIAVLALAPVLAAAQESPPTATETMPAGASPDPCRGEARADGAKIDRLRQGVFAGVCSSARWFDGMFGEPRDYAEAYDQTYGRAGVGLNWNPVDDLEPDGHFRANVHLPALGDSVNAVIGREPEETFINDNFDDTGFLPGSFSDDQGAEWYAGLSYNAVEGTNSRFDIGAGVQLKSPLNPYVKARYRYYLYLGESVLVTPRATAFWENEDGFGVTLAADTDWTVDERALLRWANTLTRSETTEGVRWKSRLAWYQGLSARSAIRYEATVRGETDGIQPSLRELKVTYRRSLWREWFFVETHGGVFWADDEDPEQRCDGCGMVGIGFELMFGDRYGRSPDPAQGGGGATDPGQDADPATGRTPSP
jgi:hypothetical protein